MLVRLARRAMSTASSSAVPLRRALATSTHAAPPLADGDGEAPVQNVVVLGGSYGGMHAASVLAQTLPPSHRVVLVERNSHFNHLYVFPRFSVLPGHEHSCFIPYTSLFDAAPVRPRRSGAAKHRAGGSAEGSAAPGTQHARHGPAGDGEALLGFSSRGRSPADSEDASCSSGSASSDTAASTPPPACDNDDKDRPVVVAQLEQQGHVHAEGEPAVAEGFEDSHAHMVLQGSVVSISATHVFVEPASQSPSKKKLWGIDSIALPYTHLIYALGSHLPDPLRTPARTKADGRAWLVAMQERIRAARDVILVGGGALGVEYATDIKSIYPEKHVTLIHSRKQLLPNFDVRVHEAAHKALTDLGVELVLGERLALSEGCPMGSTQSAPVPAPVTCDASAPGEGAQAAAEGMCIGNGRRRVRTTTGRELEADMLLLCTGQQPASSLMAQLSPGSVDASSRLVRVRRTLQVACPEDAVNHTMAPTAPCGDCDCFLDKKADSAEREKLLAEEEGVECLPNVYAIGDVADAFGALNAGYQAWNMADIAAANILSQITAPASPLPARFNPAPHMLKLSLGVGKMVSQGPPELDEATGVTQPKVEVKEDPLDLGVKGVWGMAGHGTEDLYL